MKRLILLLTAFVLWSASLPASTPEADAVIAKARAWLGGDAALDAITAIHYFGSIEIAETPAAAAPADKTSVEIIFQKPCQHRLLVTTDKAIDITGLDDYIGWRRVEPAGGVRAQQSTLNREQIKRIRANAWENLYFWSGIERHGGTILDQGDATIDGIACRKLVMDYGSGIQFVRYFDKATGRLVLTETPPAGTIREEGEIIVSGVRFAKKIVRAAPPGPDGKTRVVTITFDRIALNETFPASTFQLPLPGGLR